MAILILYISLLVKPIYGLDITNIFQNDKGGIYLHEEGSKTEDQTLAKVQTLVHDPQQRISINIVSPPFLIPLIHWWFKVYAYFDDQVILIHDSAEPLMIYDIIDFSKLSESGLNRVSRSLIQNDLIGNKVDELKKSIETNKTTQLLLSANQIKSHFKTIKQRKSRIQLLRSQLGQKRFFSEGMGNFEFYAPYINYMLEKHTLPSEMVSIAFVESSFNSDAHSKAMAKGLWQVMPHISDRLLGECGDCDYRDDALLSTWIASYLLRENLTILKDLPLAVTAYNSGIAPIIKTKSELKKKKKSINIESYFQNVRDKSIGFASRNYYSEFVAATIALAYRDEIYQIPFKKHEKEEFQVAVARCSFKYNPGTFWKNASVPVNQHLTPGRTYRKGTFVVTDKKELKNFFVFNRLPEFGKRPIVLASNLLKKNYKCSTR